VSLTCSDLEASFGAGDTAVEVLAGMSFHVADQEFVSVVGPSGCGKSTLLRLIAGTLKPTQGTIAFSGRATGHHDTAMVFQDHALLPWLDVLDNIALPLEARKVKRAERRAQAAHLAHRVGLEGFFDAYPHQLSGGMRQRAGIARALLADPSVLLMDEPFGSLDAQTRMVMHDELLQTWERDRRSVLFVTHDIEEAVRLSDRVIVLSGRPARVIADISVPLARPRAAAISRDPAAEELRWRVWGLLEEEARRHAKA
jgi:NitT/TauT family transport system ATP-binding protein